MYPKYEIAPDGVNWQVIETKLTGPESKTPGQEVSKGVSWHANIAQAAQSLRDRLVAQKCYNEGYRVTVEAILNAFSESNAIIKAAIEDATLNQLTR